MPQFFSQMFWRSITCLILLYLIGILGYVTNLSAILLVVFAILAAILAYRSLDKALYLAFIELFSNPHGTLLSAQISGFDVSMRMAIFTGIMIGWGIGLMERRYCPMLTDGRLRLFLPLILAATYGMILGILSWREPLVVFRDANAYLYLFYLLPILCVDWNQKRQHELLQILAAGALWIGFISLTIFYLFTHFGETLLTPTYEFLRDLRLAEVTNMGNGVFRVFIQSQMFTIFFGWFVFTLSLTACARTWLVWIGTVVVSVFLLALSRSFWAGFLPAFGFILLMFHQIQKLTLTVIGHVLRYGASIIILGVAVLFIVAVFPLPRSHLESATLVDSLTERATETDDVALSSRWKLLLPMLEEIGDRPIAGHGFGKAVTFESDDPRIRAVHPDGIQSTTAMEWGWLELWIKMGLLGPMAFLYVAYALIKRLWIYRWTSQAWLGLSLTTGIVFLFSTHFFSPYLNHPIGLGYLLFIVPFLPNTKFTESHSAVTLNQIMPVRRPATTVVTSSDNREF